MTWKALFLLTLLAFSLLCLGCDDKIKTSDEDIKQLSYPELRAILADPMQKTILLDPRTQARFDAGHIPGAVHIPLADLTTGESALANTLNIVVYGTTWTDYMSPAAAKKLMALGYRNVFVFRGGLDLWSGNGGKVDGNPPATQPATQN